jgi:malate synthase
MHSQLAMCWLDMRNLARSSISALLTLALPRSNFSPEAVQQELENNCQSILGYVVRAGSTRE